MLFLLDSCLIFCISNITQIVKDKPCYHISKWGEENSQHKSIVRERCRQFYIIITLFGLYKEY